MSKIDRTTQEHATTASPEPTGWQWATAAVTGGAGVAYLVFGLPDNGIATNVVFSISAGAWLTWFSRKAVADFLRETRPEVLRRAEPAVVRVFAGRNGVAAAPALTCENEESSDRRRPSPGRDRDGAEVLPGAAVPGLRK